MRAIRVYLTEEQREYLRSVRDAHNLGCLGDAVRQVIAAAELRNIVKTVKR